jgi:hypothetical protein
VLLVAPDSDLTVELLVTFSDLTVEAELLEVVFPELLDCVLPPGVTLVFLVADDFVDDPDFIPEPDDPRTELSYLPAGKGLAFEGLFICLLLICSNLDFICEFVLRESEPFGLE